MKAGLNPNSMRKHVWRSYNLYSSVQRSVSAAESSKYQEPVEQ